MAASEPVGRSSRSWRQALVRRLRARVVLIVPLAALVLAVALKTEEPRALAELRAKVFDGYQRWQDATPSPVPARVIDIDDQTLARFGQWPWPRTLVAELTRRLYDLGAAVVVFDMLFAEPDRTSPQSMAAQWRLDGELARSLTALPDHDTVLAHTIAGTPTVLGILLRSEAGTGPPPAKAGIAIANGNAAAAITTFAAARAPIQDLVEAAAGLGAMNVIPDADGIVRRAPIMFRVGEQVVPSLAAETLRAVAGAGAYILWPRAGQAAGLDGIGIGSFRIPTDRQGHIWIRYRPAYRAAIPAWSVLDGTLAAAAIKGSIALVGTSAPGLLDLHNTPTTPAAPGVMVHAQIIEQLLRGDWLTRPEWAVGAEATFLFLVGLSVIFASGHLGAALTAAMAGLAMTLAAIGSWFAFERAGYLFDPVYPGIAVLAIYVVTQLTRHIEAEYRRRFVEKAFSSYVSPNLVRHFIRNPQELRLGGERRECSFVLTDLAGFTALVESSDPAALVSVLNDYIDEMTSIVFAHDGTLDRIVGDAVAAIFSAPVVQPDHAERAVACAIAMDRFAQTFAAAKRAQGIAISHTRIGVNTGPVIIGNVGGRLHSDYRALGDAINTAARLESANRHLGTRVCVSETTVRSCRQFNGRPVGKLRLKGKRQALDCFEPLASEQLSTPAITGYLAAYALLDRDAVQARAAFAALQARFPDDPLIGFHHRRLSAGETGSLIVFPEK